MTVADVPLSFESGLMALEASVRLSVSVAIAAFGNGARFLC
jgi:hypothetical protein